MKGSGKLGAAVLFEQGCISCSTLMASSIVAHSGDHERFAEFFMGQALAYVVLTFGRCLTSVPLAALAGGLPAGARGSIYSASAVFMAVVVGLGGLSVSVVDTGGDISGVFLVAALVTAPGLLVREFARSVMVVERQAMRIFVAGFGYLGVNLGGVLGLYWCDALDASHALVVMGLSGVLPYGMLHLAGNWRVHSLRGVLGAMGSILIFGKWVIVTVAFNAVGVRMIPWILEVRCTAEDVAQYAGIATAVAIMNPLFNALGNFLTPLFAHTDRMTGRDAMMCDYRWWVCGGSVVTLMITAVAFLVGGRFIAMLFPSVASAGDIAVAMMAFETGLRGLGIVQSSAMRALRVEKREAKSAAVGAVIAAALGWTIIPRSGMVGAAFTLTASYLAVLMLGQYWIRTMRRRQAGGLCTLHPGDVRIGTRVFLRDGLVFKSASGEAVEREAAMARRAREIALLSGAWRVPAVISVDAGRGLLATEWVDGATPLGRVLASEDGLKFVRAAARALAELHLGCAVPPEEGGGRHGLVLCHGDYNCINLLVGRDGVLTVIDWDPSAAWRDAARPGSIELDIATFLRAMASQAGGLGVALAKLPVRTRQFLTVYEEVSGRVVDADRLLSYLDALWRFAVRKQAKNAMLRSIWRELICKRALKRVLVGIAGNNRRGDVPR